MYYLIKFSVIVFLKEGKDKKEGHILKQA